MIQSISHLTKQTTYNIVIHFLLLYPIPNLNPIPNQPINQTDPNSTSIVYYNNNAIISQLPHLMCERKGG